MNCGENILNQKISNKLNPSISVIIPVYNEEKFIGKLLQQLEVSAFQEIIVVDAGSSDDTKKVVSSYNVHYLNTRRRGRATQMNEGAKHSSSDYLLFLHADVSLPTHFKDALSIELGSKQIFAANFSIRFASNNLFLHWNAKFSRYNYRAFQFGDQGLLVKRNYFEQLGGFNESLLFMEGNEIVGRAIKQRKFRKLPIQLTVSARKYEKYGAYRLQLSYVMIYCLVKVGVSQKIVKGFFQKFF